MKDDDDDGGTGGGSEAREPRAIAAGAGLACDFDSLDGGSAGGAFEHGAAEAGAQDRVCFKGEPAPGAGQSIRRGGDEFEAEGLELEFVRGARLYCAGAALEEALEDGPGAGGESGGGEPLVATESEGGLGVEGGGERSMETIEIASAEAEAAGAGSGQPRAKGVKKQRFDSGAGGGAMVAGRGRVLRAKHGAIGDAEDDGRPGGRKCGGNSRENGASRNHDRPKMGRYSSGILTGLPSRTNRWRVWPVASRAPSAARRIS